LVAVRHRLSLGGSEKIQLTGLLGSFKIAVEIDGKKRMSESVGVEA
jgi:hypothetical protein